MDLRSQFEKINMKNCELKEENGNTVHTLNKYNIANVNPERKLEQKKVTVTVSLPECRCVGAKLQNMRTEKKMLRENVEVMIIKSVKESRGL